jgi:hypothetical protein
MEEKKEQAAKQTAALAKDSEAMEAVMIVSQAIEDGEIQDLAKRAAEYSSAEDYIESRLNEDSSSS